MSSKEILNSRRAWEQVIVTDVGGGRTRIESLDHWHFAGECIRVLESMPDDPDFDRLIDAAVKVLREFHHGYQRFRQFLTSDEAKEFRQAMIELNGVFKSCECPGSAGAND